MGWRKFYLFVLLGVSCRCLSMDIFGQMDFAQSGSCSLLTKSMTEFKISPERDYVSSSDGEENKNEDHPLTKSTPLGIPHSLPIKISNPNRLPRSKTWTGVDGQDDVSRFLMRMATMQEITANEFWSLSPHVSKIENSLNECDRTPIVNYLNGNIQKDEALQALEKIKMLINRLPKE